MEAWHENAAEVAWVGVRAIYRIPMPNDKPLLANAVFCDKVEDAEGGGVNLVRIIDTYVITPLPGIAPDTIHMLPMVAFLSVKSGDFQGTGQVTAKMRGPDGFTGALPGSFTMVLNGGEHGAQLRLSLNFPVAKLGVWYMDYFWNGELFASAPFRLSETAPPAPTAS